MTWQIFQSLIYKGGGGEEEREGDRVKRMGNEGSTGGRDTKRKGKGERRNIREKGRGKDFLRVSCFGGDFLRVA